MLVSSPYPLTGTASEAVVKGYVSRTKWIGRSPRLLAGMEMSLTLEKHRHLKPGSSTTLLFSVAELLSCSVARSLAPSNPATQQPGNPLTP
jgi:hypothetical protein